MPQNRTLKDYSAIPKRGSLIPTNELSSFSDQTSNTSYFPSRPHSPVLKNQVNTFMNVNNFLKKAQRNYVKVEMLNVRVADSESESNLQETSLICAEKLANKGGANTDASNTAQNCNFDDYVDDNHYQLLTMKKSSEADSIISSGRKSADQLSKSEMLLKPNLVNKSSTSSLILPEIVGRKEKLV